ncbi:MAG: glycosyltransferase [Nitrospiraceae bacterium]|nr:MAG: glycosyltransferase [Nitrospiraceae bacterium]
MNGQNPRVSIGLPVYNGEKFLGAAIDSVLSQTFVDFELIISDNASTDSTGDICRAYAARDARVRYFRNETNLGATKNFNRVFELSSGEYFKWCAADDVCAVDFLEKCVEALDRDPSVVLCYSKTRGIDEYGRDQGDLDFDLDIGSRNPHRRFHDLVCVSHPCFAVFGVVRAGILRETMLIGNYVSSDRVLLAQLSLYGRFYEVPEYLFFRRNHPETSQRLFPSYYARAEWFDPGKKGAIVFPAWKVFMEYFRSIRGAPLNRREQARCYMQIVRWITIRKNWSTMLLDLMMGTGKFMQRIGRV